MSNILHHHVNGGVGGDGSPRHQESSTLHQQQQQHQLASPIVITMIDDDINDARADTKENLLTPYVIQFIKRPPKRSAPLSSHITDLRVQEGLIIKDLTFVLIGLEGLYIKYGQHYDPNVLDSLIHGMDFKVAKNFDVSLKMITKEIYKLGKYYSGLMSFIENYNTEKYGKVVQKFCQYVFEFLQYYKSVILDIEHELNYNSSFNLSTLGNLLHQKVSNKLRHLYQIAIEIHGISQERANMSEDHYRMEQLRSQDSSKNSKVMINLNPRKFKCCKGGLALQLIQKRISYYKGDHISSDFLRNLFDIVSQGYVKMLNQWLIEGVIDDPFNEFLIQEKVSPSSLTMFGPKSEYYWKELFLLNVDGLLDQFSNPQIQSKILNTGKYLSIFKSCTGLDNFKRLREKFQPITSLNSPDLEVRIDEFYKRANKMFMKLLFQGYNFKRLIKNYQSIFLLDNSYQIDNFLQVSFHELKRDKLKISISRLLAHYNDLFKPNKNNRVGTIPTIEDILREKQVFSIHRESFYKVAERVLVADEYKLPYDQNGTHPSTTSLLQQQQKSTAPDSASSVESRAQSSTKEDQTDNMSVMSVGLSIDLPFPLSFIVRKELSYRYEIMFKLLINMKFLGKINDSVAKDLNYSNIWKYKGFDANIKKLILRYRTLHARVRNFINEIQSYINYDVIEMHFGEIRTLLDEIEKVVLMSELGSDISLEEQVFNGGSLFGGGGSITNSIFDTRILDKLNNTTNQTPAKTLILNNL
ncbi:alp4 [[Candida] subhashii]|uniref:Spindle pole body component n=1 Tax=[Candida] subhashii TaxID=561895 RepID=A0A8J5QGH0_9ASCO|nr:alp4 [[Candida] subhashii]KAG7662622.1 alp4 [[Candida] subhashii]